MPNEKQNLPACVILASGEGKRFGGQKLLAPFRGKPLLLYTLQHFSPDLFCKRLVVTRDAAIAALCRQEGIAVLQHTLPQKSDTIRLAVHACADTCGCLFSVGDQPLCTADSIFRMVQTFLSHPQDIVRLYYGETAGNPVLFPAACYPQLAALQGRQGGNAILPHTTIPVRRVLANHAWELWDTDTPEDFKRLENWSDC